MPCVVERANVVRDAGLSQGRTELVREPVRLRSEQVAVERQQCRATTVPDTEQRSSVDDGPNADGDV